MKIRLTLGVFPQNLNQTVKFPPEVMLALDFCVLHKKVGGIFTVQKIRREF